MSQGKIKNADINSAAAIDRAKLAAGTANGVVVNDGSGVLSSVAPGTSGNVLKSDGTSWVSGAAGLTNWTDAANSASPNATVPVVSLTATNAATNVDAAIVPKGNGALLAAVPDGATAGGNKRGIFAVDLQTTRSSNTRVASGARSVVSGGDSNAATNTSATVAGGASNTASGATSTVGGGTGNAASGTSSTIGGGQNNTAGGASSVIPGGDGGTARGLTGVFAFSSGTFSSNGDAQWSCMNVRAQTTNATPAVLTSNSGAASSTNVLVLPNSSAYTVEARVVARNPSNGDSASWVLRARVKRGANAAATTIGTVQTDFSDSDAGAATWAATLIADTTLGAVEVQVTGVAATTLRWVATMNTTEVQ